MQQLTLDTKRKIMKDFFANVAGPEFLEWMEDTGYYEKPAASENHSAYEGGLFDLSLQVAYELIRLTDKLELKWERTESPAVIGMLHDVCKMEDYLLEQDPAAGRRFKLNLEREWPGHGDKSLIMLLGHINLTEEEKMCIRYHMGAFTDQKEWDFYSRAVRKYPNVLYTHMADMIASQIKGV